MFPYFLEFEPRTSDFCNEHSDNWATASFTDLYLGQNLTIKFYIKWKNSVNYCQIGVKLWRPLETNPWNFKFVLYSQMAINCQFSLNKSVNLQSKFGHNYKYVIYISIKLYWIGSRLSVNKKYFRGGPNCKVDWT